MATAIQSTPAANDIAGKVDAGRTRLAENFEMFLTLLTTQLRKDRAPMDGNSSPNSGQMTASSRSAQKRPVREIPARAETLTHAGGVDRACAERPRPPAPEAPLVVRTPYDARPVSGDLQSGGTRSGKGRELAEQGTHSGVEARSKRPAPRGLHRGHALDTRMRR